MGIRLKITPGPGQSVAENPDAGTVTLAPLVDGTSVDAGGAGGALRVVPGATGAFTSADGKTVTVVKGLITSIQ